MSFSNAYNPNNVYQNPVVNPMNTPVNTPVNPGVGYTLGNSTPTRGLRGVIMKIKNVIYRFLPFLNRRKVRGPTAVGRY